MSSIKNETNQTSLSEEVTIKDIDALPEPELASPPAPVPAPEIDAVKQKLYGAIKTWAMMESVNIVREKTMRLNFPFAFKGLGEFGEYLALLMFPGSIGSASKGGCSFDNKVLDPETKELITAREIKFVSLDGSKACAKCGQKAPRFQEQCLYCGSKEFALKNDSRAGISAKAHIQYGHLIKETIIFVSKYDECNNTIHFQAFKFMTDNEYFHEYIKTQNENGKADTCNFLPFSYDWYASGPIRLMDLTIDMNGDITETYYNIENTSIESVPLKNPNTGGNVFRKNELTDLLSQLSLDDKSKKDELQLDYEQVKHMLHPRKKAHGKARGEVTRK